MSFSPTHSQAAPTILVVDDSLENRMLAEARLHAAGYRVLQADSGARALELFAEEPCDLVLLDVKMPGLDGFQTLDELRRLPRGGDVAVVFLTALDDVVTHERALRAGVDDYLTKPLRATELLIRVRSLLRVAQTMNSLRTSHALVSTQRDELIRGRDLRRQLSTFVVHDLKSPLAIIMAASDLVQRTLPKDSAPKLQLVKRAATNMLRMVHNLLDIARSEDGRLSPRSAELDVRRLVEDTVQSMRGLQGEWHAAIGIETHYDLSEPRLSLDAQLLPRVLENLLDNALRYSPTDGCIRVELSRSGQTLSLVVHDQGPGITAEQRARMFDTYAGLEDNNPGRVGHGLGLVFCRLALEAQGGRIWIESDGENGAAFHASLPLG